MFVNLVLDGGGQRQANSCLVASQSILLELQINGRVCLKIGDQHSRLMSGFYTHMLMHLHIYMHFMSHTHVCIHLNTQRILEWFGGIYLTNLLALFLLICHMEIKYREVFGTCRVIKELSISKMMYQWCQKLSPVVSYPLGVHSQSITLPSL